tara:strand:- start:513 stop:1205 length:693 start_codon:yes stop_codon:yes gene_type:complete
MAFRIESYLYASIDGVRKLSISENGTNIFTFTLTTSKTVVAALAEWTSLVNASGDLSGTYLFGYSDTTSRVTLARTDGGQFYYRLEGSLAAALGFTYSASLSSQAASFTGANQPGCVANPIGLHHDPPEASVEISKKIRRLGRANVQAHYGALMTECEMLVTTAVADVLLAGPMFTSRGVLYQSHTESDAYSSTETSGNLDVYGHTVTSVERIGFNDGHTRIRWIASVAE